MIVHYWADTEQTVRKVDFRGRWNWTECEEVFIDIQGIIASKEHIVDLIADFSHSEEIPAFALSKTYKILSLLTENTGIIVLLNIRGIAKVIRVTVIQVKPEYADRLPEATTSEEAMCIINALRERIA